MLNDCQTFDHCGDAGEDVYCALTGECLEEWRRKFVDIKNERGRQCPLIEIQAMKGWF